MRVQRCKVCHGMYRTEATDPGAGSGICPDCSGHRSTGRLPQVRDRGRGHGPATAGEAEGDGPTGAAHLPQGARLTLTIMDGPGVGRKIQLTKVRTTLGSAPEADVVIDDVALRPLHCRLEAHGRRLYVKEEGTGGGIWINGVSRHEGHLDNLDELGVGPCVLLFTAVDDDGIREAESEADAAAAPSQAAATRARVQATPITPTGSPAAELKLEFLTGKLAGRVATVRRWTLSIGRQDSDLNLPDPDVSRKHLQIAVKSAGKVVAKDLASTNGTFLNGRRIDTSILRDGDELQVGETRFRLRIRPVLT